MILRPRWQKVIADLEAHWSRTLIVVASIGIGVFGIGMIASAYTILSRDLAASYTAVNPASAQLMTSPFGQDLVRQIARQKGVRQAEGKIQLTGRVRVGTSGAFKSLILFSYGDFSDIKIAKVESQSGAWPPPDRQVVLERSATAPLGLAEGDMLQVEMPDGTKHEMRIAGTAHDLTHVPTSLGGVYYGYVTIRTLKWLGQSPDFNELDVTVAKQPLDETHIRQVAQNLRDKRIEGTLGTHTVYGTYIPTPGKHPLDSAIQTALFLFFALGLLSLLLSGLLVINTIEALLASQIRQIGIMKAVGGRAGQIGGVYIANVFVYGVLGLLVGIPAAALAARAITTWLAGLFNFDISSFSTPPQVLALEISVGLVVPLLAALWPIISGTRVPARQAMSGFGLGPGHFGASRFDRLLERPSRLPRQLLLSIRNTFRHKGRLGLTLVTLTLGGAIFMSVMSVRSSLLATIDTIGNYWGYDVVAHMNKDYPSQDLVRYALKLPNVKSAEGWLDKNATRLRPDGTENENLSIEAIPPQTPFLRPTLLDGRWVRASDTNEIAVNKDFIKNEPDVHVGSEVTLKIEGKEHAFKVVGVTTGQLRGTVVFANYAGFSQIVEQSGQASRLVVATKDRSAAAQQRTATAIEEQLKHLGYKVDSTDTNALIRSRVAFQFNILVTFLLIMAIILAAVGGLGLMGTMSINVLERTREIAVMRAIGASDSAVVGIFLVEGLLVGLIGCALGSVVAIPMSRVLSDTVGMQFFGSPLSYSFSVPGVGLWLVTALAMAALASLAPSWRASRISVQDALAYE